MEASVQIMLIKLVAISLGVTIGSLVIGWLFLKIFKPQLGGERRVSGYKTRNELLNSSESALFYALIKELPSDYFVFPKMRLADIFETTEGTGYYLKRNKILPRHVDFVICNKYFKPLLVIELDGKSHMNKKVKMSDKIKNELFENISLQFMRIEVGMNFEDVTQIVRGNLNLNLQKSVRQ